MPGSSTAMATRGCVAPFPPPQTHTPAGIGTGTQH
jgi:hypothetical protein